MMNQQKTDIRSFEYEELIAFLKEKENEKKEDPYG